MNDRTDYKTTPQNSRTAERCTESKCGPGLRNNYFEGKRLTADSFSVEQKYIDLTSLPCINDVGSILSLTVNDFCTGKTE